MTMDGGLHIAENSVTVGGRTLPLEVRRNPRARRITLRLDTARHCLVLTLPRGVSQRSGLKFLRDKGVWLQNQLVRVPPPVPFADGVEIPYIGAPHRIRHRPDTRAGVWRVAPPEAATREINVSGAAEHLPRRVTDWLKAEARHECAARARDKAGLIDKTVKRVSVRETSSRWGSASSLGNLNFSWRLIFAPEHVLDYVVAHEVAHLAEMNHSERFWSIVGNLTAAPDEARNWLRVHGAGLHRYGRSV